MNRDLVRQVAVTGAVVGNIVSGVTQNFSDTEESPSLIVPAGYAFAIWGPVYAGSLAHVVDQARPARRDDPVMRRTGWPLAAAFAAPAVWIRLDARPLRQLATIAASGAGSALLYAAAQARPDDPAPTADLDGWTIRAPVGLYTGWITVASLVGATEALRRAGLRTPPPEGLGWTLGGLTAAAAVAGTAGRRPLSPTYPTAVAWGLAAVAVRAWTRRRVVSGAATTAAGAVLASWTIRARPRDRTRRPA